MLIAECLTRKLQSETQRSKSLHSEYPVGTAEECADMIHEFEPIARAVVGLSDLKDHQLWT